MREKPPLSWSAHRVSLGQAVGNSLQNQYPHLSQDLLEWFLLPMATSLAEMASKKSGPHPFLIAISGAQGSGKSTLSRLLSGIFQEVLGVANTCLSLDDFYLTQRQRQELAETTHPLFATRGVPGTHDTNLLLATLDQFKRPGQHASQSATPNHSVRSPRFNKGTDDREPKEHGYRHHPTLDIILLEGWCLGARPWPESHGQAVNELERTQDTQGIWRHTILQKLQTDYAALNKRFDQLIFLEVPNLNAVIEWRHKQEKQLDKPLFKNRSDIQNFVAYFQRLTQWMLEDTPNVADITLHLDEKHQFKRFTLGAKTQP